MKTDRFWKKVDIKDDDQCWEWKAAVRSDGYGVIRVDGQLLAAHRVSWEIYYDRRVPFGMLVLHRCDNRKCVNPRHLFLGSHQDNMDDMYTKGRRIAASGENNGSSKLTQADVNLIRELHNTTNLSMREIARRFGVVHGTIRKIITGRTWVELGGSSEYY